MTHTIAAVPRARPHHQPDPVITVRNLHKRYGEIHAVRGLDLEVGRGQVYGFLGPNGAGKTTTIRMLLGLIRPSSGSVRLLGKTLEPNRANVLAKIGAIVETPSAYAHLTGRENLEVARRMLGAAREHIPRLLALVGLSDAADRPVRGYSLGMKGRLSLAAALLNDPELLILDEPTNGLDPSGIREVRDLIRTFPAHGVTVLVSSHLLSEIEQIVTHVRYRRTGSEALRGHARGAARPINAAHRARGQPPRGGARVRPGPLLERQPARWSARGSRRAGRSRRPQPPPDRGRLRGFAARAVEGLTRGTVHGSDRTRGGTLMLVRSLWAETLKYRRTPALFLALAGPFLVTVLIGVVYALNPNLYGMSPAQKWTWLENALYATWTVLFLPLGTAMIAALATNLEHADNQLKQILCLPPSRAAVYAAKLIAVLGLVLAGSLVLALSFAGLGALMGASSPIPWKTALGTPIMAFIVLLPVLGLSVWLGLCWKSFAVGTSLNIGGTVAGTLAARSSTYWLFVPWTYPFIATRPEAQLDRALILAAVLGVIVIAWGFFDFRRRDVL